MKTNRKWTLVKGTDHNPLLWQIWTPSGQLFAERATVSQADEATMKMVVEAMNNYARVVSDNRKLTQTLAGFLYKLDADYAESKHDGTSRYMREWELVDKARAALASE